MIVIRKWALILFALFALALSACATSSCKPFEYETDRELKPGPGLFTGETGVYTIYKKSAEEELKKPEKN